LKLIKSLETPEKRIQRMGALSAGWPSLLDDGDRLFEIVYDREKNILYWADWISCSILHIAASQQDS
jgi:hypothetical protein